MKKALVAAILAALAISAQARQSSADDHWFGVGLAWYEHPCGLEAFNKYGHDDSPEVRRAYELTKRHPEQCSALFP
jgi:hypothetical protein